MNTVPWFSLLAPTDNATTTLTALGFVPDATGYKRDHVRLTLGPRWCVLEAPRTSQLDDFSGELGQPGLWKHVRLGQHPRRVFAFPTSLAHHSSRLDADDENPAGMLARCTDWALQTLDPPARLDWLAPPRALVESWFAPEQLTVFAGPIVRQGQLTRAENQLSIRFPIVPQLPPDLPASRRAWLRTLLADGQRRWHLARLGFVEDPSGASLVAEVDLTGAPAEIAEELFVTSLETLRYVLQWLGESASWLADVTVTSELLANCPNQEPQKGAT